MQVNNAVGGAVDLPENRQRERKNPQKGYIQEV